MKIYDFRGHNNVCGRNIRRLRRARKLSQIQLADRIQTKELMLERGSISRIELGKRFVADYELIILAQVLGVPIERLIEIPDAEHTS